MTRSSKLKLLKIAAGIVAALILLVVVVLVVAQSPWFQNYVTDKVIATVEESTGGRAEIGSFSFDPRTLTVRITNFTLHGTEAPGKAPLAHIALLELHLKLLAGLKKSVDLAYLGITDPKVNLIVNADGTTNIPSPKIKTAPSKTSPLQTVVDLAVGEFKIDNGLLLYSQTASPFSASGNNLRALINFNSFNSSYAGHLLIDPVLINTGQSPPLRVHVDLPLMIEKDTVSINGGRLSTNLSQLALNLGLRDLNSPQITAHVNGAIALSDLGVAVTDPRQSLTEDLSGSYNDKTNTIQLQMARLQLARSTLEASGTLQPGSNQNVQFKTSLVLDELARLFKVENGALTGTAQLQGHAMLGNQQLTVDSNLSNLAFADLGYAGVISGTINVNNDLKAKGLAGLTAQTHLAISPGLRGIPVRGEVNGQFVGASNRVELAQSYVALPHTRLDLAGDINQQINAVLVSRNLVDFAPLTGTLPITLQGAAKVSATIRGDLSSPTIQAHAAIDRFEVQGSPFQQLQADLNATSSGASVTNGTLNGSGLNSDFAGSVALYKWALKPNSAVMLNASLAGPKDPFTSAKVSGRVRINGTYRNPSGTADLQLLNGIYQGQSFQKAQAHIDLLHQLINLTQLEIDTAGGQILGNGSFRRPGHADFHLTASDIELANVQPLQQKSPGAGGVLKLAADGSADLVAGKFQLSNVSTDFSARDLKVNNQPAGDLVATARTANNQVTYKLNSNFAGSTVDVSGTTSLDSNYTTKANASIGNLPVQRALALAGQGDIPVSGLLSANANVSGTIADPDATVQMTLSKADIYSEPVDQFTTQVHYTPTSIEFTGLNLKAPAGALTASGQYSHKDGDLHNGQMNLHLHSGEIDLSKVPQSPLSGTLAINTDLAGLVQDKKGQPPLLLSDADANIQAHSLHTADRNLGDVNFTANTVQHILKYNLASNFVGSNLTASGQTELSNEYLTHAKFTIGNLRWVESSFSTLVDGQGSVDGPALLQDALSARLQLNRLMFDASARGRGVHLANDAPAILTLDHSVIKVDHLKVQDAKSYLQLSGAFNLKDEANALGLKVQGNADLGIVEAADRDFYSSGNVLLDATLHGSLSKPLLNGRAELKNANINYAAVSNGLSNGNGVILLNGTNATIQNLTGESGGGKVSLTGFAGFTPLDTVFNIHGTATKVRTRYADTSVTSNADVSLAGNLHRSTLSGTVTVQRVEYSSSSDVGSFLSTAAAPPSSPSSPSPFLSAMRLDLRIVTAADLRVISTYSDKLSLTSNLTISGTAETPGIVGRVAVTSGQLVFFGNTYNVNNGSINFYNANAIQPILNLSLETLSQGVDVTLGVTGPVNNLKLAYRSDPPLSFEQIVQLLATNTTPSDPTIAAHQPTPPQQSASQLGESALLGQAVANPLASRVQRVFGLTQFKIDPSLSGSNGQPSARVTLQQKITSNLTFTYITDVTQTNSEIVRVALDLTPRVSAVALRDYNGNVSVELFYKFQVR